MRAALGGLTSRGRGFLVVGLVTVVAALVVGQSDLLRIGIFLCAVPLLAALFVARTRYRLSCVRRLVPPRISAGHAAEVVLRLENVSRLPTGVLLAEDTLPYQLGGRPRFILDRVEPLGVREVSYRVRSDLRGRYRIGPLSVQLTEPFGLCRLTRSFAVSDVLVVTPPVTALPPVRLPGDWAGGGESRLRSVALAGEDDVATREYRQGDELRRVHWRSTARYGELMVRREEQPWQSRGSLLLDTRSRAHHGDGPASSFEWAVNAAASIGAHLSRTGFAMRYLSAAGEELRGGADLSGVGFEELLLDRLAVAATTRHTSLELATQLLRRGTEGLVVAVLGELSATDAESLARLRRGQLTAVAVVLETATWGPRPSPRRSGAADPHADAIELLARAGWRVVPVRHGARLTAAWRQAGTGPPGSARTPPALVVAGRTEDPP